MGRLGLMAAPLVAVALIAVVLYGIGLIVDAVRFLTWLFKQK